jgi:tRNA (mo5U34)-methyltransferase
VTAPRAWRPLFADDVPAYAAVLPRASQQHLASLRHAWRAALRADERQLLEAIHGAGEQAPGPLPWVVRGAEVVVGTSSGHASVRALLEALCPWKKGPFEVQGVAIDAEWRSDLKWDRVVRHLELRGKRVADIGSHNGYFMLRAAEHEPELVVGLEPVFRPQAQWALLQTLAQVPGLESEPLGVADMARVYPEFFDVVLCLGILYHHTDPVGLLRTLAQSMQPGGQLMVDCQGIAGYDSTVLVPEGRYCGARGIWWLPTAPALQAWMRRAGFREVELVYSAPLSTDEQRSTPWAPIKSLCDFLDPRDGTRTIEGYPAPWRHYVRARR